MALSNRNQEIWLYFGIRQRFRYRCEDLHFPGSTTLALPVKVSQWRLNQGPLTYFYVERPIAAADPANYPWKSRTPAVNRLRNLPGHFNIEVPVTSPYLRPGENILSITIEGRDGRHATQDVSFSWVREPVGLPLDLSDLSRAETIQDVGQVVDGHWDLDNERNTIKSRAPVGYDALLLLGGPHQSQEATYEVMFSAPLEGGSIGLSDFFIRHDEQMPSLGIKPGYSTAGLATISSKGVARCWIAMGDCTWDKAWSWVKKTTPAFVSLDGGVAYAVRHQVVFDGTMILTRFRIWQAGRPEPSRWLSNVDTGSLSPELPRPTAASFGLFQNRGKPSQWSKIRIRPIEGKINSDDLAPRHSLHDEWRKARYRAGHAAKAVRRKLRILNVGRSG